MATQISTSEAKQVAEAKAAIDGDPKLSVKNIHAITTFPVIENSYNGGLYFPDGGVGGVGMAVEDENKFSREQNEARSWMLARIMRGEPYETTVQRSLVHRTMNLESDTFTKDATLLEKYYIIQANMGGKLDSVQLGKITEHMKAKNLLMPAAESELFRTHYYEQMFKGFALAFKGLWLTRGIVTAGSATIHIPKHNEFSQTYATANKWTTVRPGAEIMEDVSTYTYVEATPVKHAFITSLPDEFEQDTLYPVTDVEMWRFGQRLAQLENYDLEYAMITNYGASSTDLVNVKMTTAKLLEGAAGIAGGNYTPRRCLMEAGQYWQGLLAQTGIYDYAYGSADPMQRGLVPLLYGISLDWETTTAGYLSSTHDDTRAAIITDPDYSYVFVQRYAPFVERAREIRSQTNLASITHKYSTALLYAKSIGRFIV